MNHTGFEIQTRPPGVRKCIIFFVDPSTIYNPPPHLPLAIGHLFILIQRRAMRPSAGGRKCSSRARVNVLLYEVRAKRIVSLEAGDTSKSVEEPLFVFPAEGVGGRIRSTELVRHICMASEASPRTSRGRYCCSLPVSKMRQGA